MEYLSVALVLIFVMWLIDKHNVWRQTGKLGLIVVGVALIAGASFYGWAKYKDWKAQKVALTIAEQHKAAVKECLSHIQLKYGKTDIFDKAACEANPNVMATEACLSRIEDGNPFEKMACEDDPNVQATEPCWTKADAKTGLQFDRNSFKDVNGVPVARDPNDTCYPLAHR